MTAAGLGRLAALLLPALARGWDWKTNVESTFDCETHRNPIQLYKKALYVCQGGPMTAAPTRAETYAPTRVTEAPSYAPTTDTYAPSGAPTVTAAPSDSEAPTGVP